MRILLAEHFHPCPDRLAVPLRQAGHAVDVIDDGAIADIALASEDYALAILDFALPRMDGQTVLSRLRARGQRLPVLMLTSGERAGDRVRILDLGADDCLSRPFVQDELEARLRALLRRAHAGN
ncbi:MAG: response regulator, partial [Microvirgula sp.]